MSYLVNRICYDADTGGSNGEGGASATATPPQAPNQSLFSNVNLDNVAKGTNDKVADTTASFIEGTSDNGSSRLFEKRYFKRNQIYTDGRQSYNHSQNILTKTNNSYEW